MKVGVYFGQTEVLFAVFDICIISYYISRGEGQIEKVFVLDAHCFIRQKEEYVD